MNNDDQDTINQLQEEIEKLNALIAQLATDLAEICSQMENIKNDV